MELTRAPDDTLILALSLHDFGELFEAVSASCAEIDRSGRAPLPVPEDSIRHLDRWIREEVPGARWEQRHTARREPGTSSSRREQIVHVDITREDFQALADLVSALTAAWTDLPEGIYDLDWADLSRLNAELTRLEAAMESTH